MNKQEVQELRAWNCFTKALAITSAIFAMFGLLADLIQKDCSAVRCIMCLSGAVISFFVFFYSDEYYALREREQI